MSKSLYISQRDWYYIELFKYLEGDYLAPNVLNEVGKNTYWHTPAANLRNNIENVISDCINQNPKRDRRVRRHGIGTHRRPDAAVYACLGNIHKDNDISSKLFTYIDNFTNPWYDDVGWMSAIDNYCRDFKKYEISDWQKGRRSSQYD